VYFRSGYEPAQYHGDLEWESRLKIERSRAIKCPSIYYHLAGTKKVQQSLADSQTLERFLGSDKQKIEAVRNIFTGLYSLDKVYQLYVVVFYLQTLNKKIKIIMKYKNLNREREREREDSDHMCGLQGEMGDKALQMALEQPAHFVLKPQREGGGNNKYGEQVRNAVLTMKDSEERSAWILMERIVPPVQSNYVVRPGDPNNSAPPLSDVVSELGIFGVIIG
jgi:hypothetical protein